MTPSAAHENPPGHRKHSFVPLMGLYFENDPAKQGTACEFPSPRLSNLLGLGKGLKSQWGKETSGTTARTKW